MERSDSIKELTAALAKAQSAFLPVKQTEKVDYPTASGRKSYKYAPLSNVLDACRKALSDNGLAIMQPTKMSSSHLIEGEHLVVETLLAHSSGEWIKSEISIEAKAKDPQSIGSALTYARRYALSALLGIASEEDDDAGGAVGKESEGQGKSEEHWCYKHNTAFVRRAGVGKAGWWSHKTADGWCNEDKEKKTKEAEKLKNQIYEPSKSSAVSTTETKTEIDPTRWSESGKDPESPGINIDDIILQMKEIPFSIPDAMKWFKEELKIDVSGKTFKQVIAKLTREQQEAFCLKLKELGELKG